jgi:pyrroloquinoline quinone biosynthesis protein B
MHCPRMKNFLENNGPWSQLVSLKNIAIQPLQRDSAVEPAPGIRVTPFMVPHRDEYSETAGYRIEAGGKRILFIPDIDKWEKWERDISREIEAVDIAFLDATFYKNGELQRDMREIPHPFVEESMRLFDVFTGNRKSQSAFHSFQPHQSVALGPGRSKSRGSPGIPSSARGSDCPFIRAITCTFDFCILTLTF